MRLSLEGTLVKPEPVILKFVPSIPLGPEPFLDVKHYRDLGYTHFDVICIGGGGGMGGGIDTANTGTLVRSYGGAGGGGGFHRVHGLLSALPDSVAIVVGRGGTLGAEHASNPANCTDGGDGGASTFNATTCRASGGKGGKKVSTNAWPPVVFNGDGGEGGVGNRTPAGGGALGGVAATSTVVGTNGQDGTIFQNIGKGGGGGAGGVGKYGPPGVTGLTATNGGRGSYNPSDTSVYGPGDAIGDDGPSGAKKIVPGGASGAKASPVNGLPTIYGQSAGKRIVSDDGVVVVKLEAR
jgi:hypothetical protein